MSSLAKAIVEWIKQQVDEAGVEGTVCGLSGGIDSAVTAVLCQQAFADKHLSIVMPCQSNPQDAVDAQLMIEKFSLPNITVDLSEIYQQMKNTCPDITETAEKDRKKLAEANLKPRLRMATLYYYGNLLNRLVVGTGNRSELMIGYFTKYGDGGVDILPLGNLLKDEVRELAYELDIPEKIIHKPPSAGLWEDQTDEKEMGFTYEKLNQIIRYYDKHNEFPKGMEARIAKSIQRAQHKIKLPPIFTKK